MDNKYIFRSERLGFRDWIKRDITALAELNADKDVMEHFPKTLNTQETVALVERQQEHFEKHGFNYFATELLETGEFIGFIGLYYQEYKTEFTPAIDIGWRLKKAAWGKGYATEGAKRCLDYAFNDLELNKVISVCTVDNLRSESVMQKIGMIKMGEFKHPKLKEYPEYERCVWYEIENNNQSQKT